MDTKFKTEKLKSLDEKGLSENVLIPLLNRMGYKAVSIYHGPRERGKDIICFDYDRLGNREYIAVVAKSADLNGSVSSSNSLREVVYQIEQCFDVPYEDLFGMTRITMDRVLIITSGRIVSGAADSVFDHLTKGNLSKCVRFISGESLVQLIDDKYPAYWEDSLEPIDKINEQKRRLINFCKQILISLGGDPEEIEITISNVLHSVLLPTISPTTDRSLGRVSPYRVEIDSIDSEYSHDFYATNCGLIRDAFFKAKKSIYYAMFDVDEIIDHYEKVIKKTDPKDFVVEFNHKLSEDYPFWRSSFGKSADAFNEMQYLEDGLNEIDYLKECLEKIGKLEWAKDLVDSVSLLEKEIISFLDHLEKSEFSLCWQIDSTRSKPIVRLLYDAKNHNNEGCFITEHKKEIEVYNRWKKKQKRLISVRDIISDVQYEIRLYLDKLIESHGIKDLDEI